MFKEIWGSPEFQCTRDNIHRQGPKALERTCPIFIGMSCGEIEARCSTRQWRGTTFLQPLKPTRRHHGGLDSTS